MTVILFRADFWVVFPVVDIFLKLIKAFLLIGPCGFIFVVGGDEPVQFYDLLRL